MRVCMARDGGGLELLVNPPLWPSRDLDQADPGAWATLKPRLLNPPGAHCLGCPVPRPGSESTGLPPVPCRTTSCESRLRKAGSASALYGHVAGMCRIGLVECACVCVCACVRACGQVGTLFGSAGTLAPRRVSGTQSSRCPESAWREFSRIRVDPGFLTRQRGPEGPWPMPAVLTLTASLQPPSDTCRPGQGARNPENFLCFSAPTHTLTLFVKRLKNLSLGDVGRSQPIGGGAIT